jgi:hypothetical protein
MGRKLVRENQLLRSGGLLSFPRTGCALYAAVMLSRGQKSRHYDHTRPSDSVKRHLPIEYAADLTPVVAAEEAGASWNARRMAETA